MSYFETFLDPDEVVTSSARLAGIPQDLQNAIQSIVTEIRSIDPAAACGDDPSGRALLRAYLGTSGGGDGDASENILEGSQEICGHIYNLAQNTGVSALESDAQDRESAARIEQLTEELRAHEVTASLLEDPATAERINELHDRMQDPRVTEILGPDQATEIQGWLDEVDRLAE